MLRCHAQSLSHCQVSEHLAHRYPKDVTHTCRPSTVSPSSSKCHVNIDPEPRALYLSLSVTFGNYGRASVRRRSRALKVPNGDRPILSCMPPSRQQRLPVGRYHCTLSGHNLLLSGRHPSFVLKSASEPEEKNTQSSDSVRARRTTQLIDLLIQMFYATEKPFPPATRMCTVMVQKNVKKETRNIG